MARPIIIDADPGQDDAVALLVALGSPTELDVLGITTVAGNIPLALTQRNARKIVALAGRTEVPVFAGSERPLVRDLVTAEYVHGPTGLDGAELPDPQIPLAPGHAVDFIANTVRTHPEPVTLCTLGPLTNVAMALQRAPEIADNITELVMMGGGLFEGGNVTPAAEFNIYVDPHAAAIVFASGLAITMMPLDVTHKALTTAPRVDAFRKLGTPQGDAVTGMIEFFNRYDMERYGTAGAPLHDPLVIAFLLAPELFTGRRCHVEIVTEGPAVGMTMIDWWRLTDAEPNAMVMGDVDATALFALLVERVGAVGQP